MKDFNRTILTREVGPENDSAATTLPDSSLTGLDRQRMLSSSSATRFLSFTAGKRRSRYRRASRVTDTHVS